MPTWVTVTINVVLLAYCAFMLLLGHIKKKKRIAEAKKEIYEEFKNEKENHDEHKQGK